MGFSSSASPSISATIHSILRADSSKAFPDMSNANPVGTKEPADGLHG